jgi:hypothetical protein
MRERPDMRAYERKKLIQLSVHNGFHKLLLPARIRLKTRIRLTVAVSTKSRGNLHKKLSKTTHKIIFLINDKFISFVAKHMGILRASNPTRFLS